MPNNKTLDHLKFMQDQDSSLTQNTTTNSTTNSDDIDLRLPAEKLQLLQWAERLISEPDFRFYPG